MIQLDFVLYRFLCDISTCAELCPKDAEPRGSPDATFFHCSWSRTPRAKPSSSGHSSVYPIDGRTDNVLFKVLGESMALTFPTQMHRVTLDSERDVVTFALRPSPCNASNVLPIVAKCALDPRPFFDQPKKNYAVKLRNAEGEVTGKLLFSLCVHEVVDTREVQFSSTVSSQASKPPMVGQMTLERNPSRDRLLKTPPRKVSSLPPSATSSGVKPPREDREVARAEGVSVQPLPVSATPPFTASTETRLFQRASCSVRSIDLQLEGVVVRSDNIDLDHPAPLLLGGQYSMRIRFGTYSFTTAKVVCCDPKELVFEAQKERIALQPAGGLDKLRFSLWEGKRQVAGFSLDPAKLNTNSSMWKEYSIPFRYHPTGQRAALDIRVCHVETGDIRLPTSGSAPSQPPETLTSFATTAGIGGPLVSSSVPQHSLNTTTPSNPNTQGRTECQAAQPSFSPEHPSNTTSSVGHQTSQLNPRWWSSPHRGREASQNISTPLRDPPSFVREEEQTVSGYRGARVCVASGIQGGWEQTLIQKRPPPLTVNLADLPADRRPPSDHEKYIAEVLARLEKLQQAPRQHTSLEEEWIGWREERERSRCNSVSDRNSRSPSVKSAASRADSMVSVVSRRASAPRPTNSNVNNSHLTPFSPDTCAYRHHRRHRSPLARIPLI